MASVEERVKQIIVEQLGVDEGEVTSPLHSWTIWAPTRSIPSSW
jgi:hypothetical protein